MTTLARGLPALTRAASAVAPLELAASPRIAVDFEAPATERAFTAGNAERRAVLRDHAWVEAAAIAATRMPRG
ncbi:MAG: hypothetical protein A2V84_07870 [Chloroflexi bacterium RBG_16_70_13]|nr:MAG: hypothetical protein A2V84_07870 [Chloroflexi bacterium RBG_16_70_13]